MSIASERVRSECVEATQFPELSQRYQVRAVPKIVINDRVEFEGAIPERDFVNAVLQAVNGKEPTEAGETREP
jgi:predicted DsbA family dithiol-disulfide isomerase